MNEEKLTDLNIHDVGNTIQLSGAIYSGNGKDYLCFFPGEFDLSNEMTLLTMEMDDWKKFIKQTDLMETEILAKDTDGKIVKAILRKTQRQIDARVQWLVFQRDNYTCRYCGRTGIPLTVDHLVLWEEGGPSIEENLVASCKKCNKTRGNMQYVDWLNDPKYVKVSAGLPDEVILANEELIDTLADIPRNVHKKSR